MTQPPPMPDRPQQISPQPVKKSFPAWLIILIIAVVLGMVLLIPVALGVFWFATAAEKQMEQATAVMSGRPSHVQAAQTNEKISLGVFTLQPRDKRNFLIETTETKTIGFEVLEGVPDEPGAAGVRLADVEGTPSIVSATEASLRLTPREGVIEAVVANTRDNAVRVEVWRKP